MLPRWHIILGAIFTVVVWAFAPAINPIYLGLIFLSSFLIDFDHYLYAAIKTRRLSLPHIFDYHDKMLAHETKQHKKGIREKGDFHLFHTLEFHVLIAVLGIFFTPFLFIFIGMVFHSILDIIWLIKHDMLYRRNFFLIGYLKR